MADQQKWLEAKQFPLALLEANRVDEALQITILLKEEYRIINAEVIKNLLKYYTKSQLEHHQLIHPYLYLPFLVSSKKNTSHLDDNNTFILLAYRAPSDIQKHDPNYI